MIASIPDITPSALATNVPVVAPVERTEKLVISPNPKSSSNPSSIHFRRGLAMGDADKLFAVDNGT